MKRRIALIASIALVGSVFFASGTAHAVSVPPAGNVKCNAVAGSVANSPNLFVNGTSAFKINGQGAFAGCDNTLNTGDPVYWGTFKLSGFHTAPNTCANANNPGYTLKLQIVWHTYHVATNQWSTYTTKGNLTANSAFNPGAFFTTSWTYFAGSLNVNPNLDGTWLTPSAATTSSQCGMPTAAGAFSGWSFQSPGDVSF